jgi:two-component system response regulator (stage 0 sporulation protein F)
VRGNSKLKRIQQGDGMKILVVDGEDGAREVFNNTLFRKGYQATFATSGEVALALFNKIAFDLVITDIRLPTMNGLQLLHEIKKLAPMVDVIVVTDSGTIETYLKAISLGADEYISKPFRMKDLKWLIHAFMSKRQGASGS